MYIIQLYNVYQEESGRSGDPGKAGLSACYRYSFLSETRLCFF